MKNLVQFLSGCVQGVCFRAALPLIPAAYALYITFREIKIEKTKSRDQSI